MRSGSILLPDTVVVFLIPGTGHEWQHREVVEAILFACIFSRRGREGGRDRREGHSQLCLH